MECAAVIFSDFSKQVALGYSVDDDLRIYRYELIVTTGSILFDRKVPPLRRFPPPGLADMSIGQLS